MKLLFKQRLFSWFDSYDVYDEYGNTVYTVKGQFAWGHMLKIFDAYGYELGVLKERVFAWLPKFEMYIGGRYVGCISKEFIFLKPKFNIDYNGWQIEGNFFEWDYRIYDSLSQPIAAVTKEFNWTDTYVIDVIDQGNALNVLMLVLAIDAEKCSRN